MEEFRRTETYNFKGTESNINRSEEGKEIFYYVNIDYTKKTDKVEHGNGNREIATNIPSLGEARKKLEDFVCSEDIFPKRLNQETDTLKPDWMEKYRTFQRPRDEKDK